MRVILVSVVMTIPLFAAAHDSTIQANKECIYELTELQAATRNEQERIAQAESRAEVINPATEVTSVEVTEKSGLVVSRSRANKIDADVRVHDDEKSEQEAAEEDEAKRLRG